MELVKTAKHYSIIKTRSLRGRDQILAILNNSSILIIIKGIKIIGKIK